MKKQTIDPDDKDSNPLKNYAKYSSLFIQMAIIITGGTFGGYYIDKSLGLSIPIFTIVLSLASIAAAIYLLIKDFIKFK